MQNSSNGVILQAMTENWNINAVVLQALQNTIVIAIDQLAAEQNDQNNDFTTVGNIPCKNNTVEDAH